MLKYYPRCQIQNSNVLADLLAEVLTFYPFSCKYSWMSRYLTALFKDFFFRDIYLIGKTVKYYHMISFFKRQNTDSKIFIFEIEKCLFIIWIFLNQPRRWIFIKFWLFIIPKNFFKKFVNFLSNKNQRIYIIYYLGLQITELFIWFA